MKRRNQEMQLFGVSFLDVLSCALGGVLLLLLIILEQNRQDASAAHALVQFLQGSIDQASQEVKGLEAALDDADQDRAKLAEAKTKLQKLQATLIGLKGPLRNVVFVFDTSGSMNTPAFDDYRAFLKTWVSSLTIEKFDVIRYSDDVQPWAGGLRPATPENRRDANAAIDGYVADGSTNTMGALERAFQYGEVDTIVFFSDGAPNDNKFDEVLEFLRQANRDRGVVINTIGMGNYFDNEEGWGKFLHDIADEHGGVFIGR